jgi:hypothetical protein
VVGQALLVKWPSLGDAVIGSAFVVIVCAAITWALVVVGLWR